jgi:hypothetical protein
MRLFEYSDKVIKDMVAKFKSEERTLSDEQATYYISRFEKLKESPRVTEKDITKYTFKDLEKLVDSFPEETVSTKNINTAEVKGTAIYDDNNLEVYLGDERNKCVTYKAYTQQHSGGGYSWCIARSDSSNMFNNYRYGSDSLNARIFYFVIDRDLPVTNKNHVFIVHVFDDGQYGYTSAFNDGDRTELSWDELTKLGTPLFEKSVPRELFKPKPLSDEEVKLYELTKDKVTTPDLDKHFNSNYRLVRAYIEIHEHELSDAQVKSLVQGRKTELVNLYIVKGGTLEISTLSWLPEKFRKLYAKTSLEYATNNTEFHAFSQYYILKHYNMVPEWAMSDEDIYESLGTVHARADFMNFKKGAKLYKTLYHFGYHGLPSDYTIGYDVNDMPVIVDLDGNTVTEDIDLTKVTDSSVLAMIIGSISGEKCKVVRKFGELPDRGVAVIQKDLDSPPFMINLKVEKSTGSLTMEMMMKLDGNTNKLHLHTSIAAFLNTKYGTNYINAGNFGKYKDPTIGIASKDWLLMYDIVFINTAGEPSVGTLKYEDVAYGQISAFIKGKSTLPITKVSTFGMGVQDNRYAIADLEDGSSVIIDKEGNLAAPDRGAVEMNSIGVEAHENTLRMLGRETLKERYERIVSLMKNKP